MGMFDTVVVDPSMDKWFGNKKDKVFQTKDLACCLYNYSLKDDMLHEVSPLNSKHLKVYPYTGIFTMYSYSEDGNVMYNVTVEDGVVQGIVETPTAWGEESRFPPSPWAEEHMTNWSTGINNFLEQLRTIEESRTAFEKTVRAVRNFLLSVARKLRNGIEWVERIIRGF